MNKRAIKIIVFLSTVLFVTLACELPLLPLPVASNPTPAPGSLETIVVATAGAAQTQTALVKPPPTITSTSTPVPTSTHTETPTPTETIIFFTATKPPTATEPFVAKSVGANCELVSQTPGNNAVFASRQKFTTEWRVKNTGSITWLSNDNDFFHSGGTDMHSTDAYDLPNDVVANGEVSFQVPMVAPKNPGTYTSTWSLGSKKSPICKLSVTIIVQ